MKRRAGFWELPKGHAEEGESSIEAAFRELYEEAHLEVEELLSLDPLQVSYTCDGYEKTVFYFIATVIGNGECDGKETLEGKWLFLNEAKEQLTYPTSKSLIQRVDAFLHVG